MAPRRASFGTAEKTKEEKGRMEGSYHGMRREKIEINPFQTQVILLKI
jgi:hypothetical protein